MSGVPGMEHLRAKRVMRAWQVGPALVLRLEGGTALVAYL
jgi:hypothetical protein